MRLRSLLCALAVLAVLAGDSESLNIGQANAELIVKRPFYGINNGRRRYIELNVRLNAYYGYGYYDRRYGPYYGDYAVGPGLQMLFPVVQNGFIKSINNAFYVGFFTDFLFLPDPFNNFGNGFFSFAIGPMAQWRFFLFDIFSVFGNLGFGIWPWFVGGPYGNVVQAFPLFQVGGNVHFTQRIALTFVLGYPSVNLGVSFGF